MKAFLKKIQALVRTESAAITEKMPIFRAALPILSGAGIHQSAALARPQCSCGHRGVSPAAPTQQQVSSAKKLIRSKISQEIKSQKEEDRNNKSRRIKRKLFRLDAFKQARMVMFYIALDGEVNTEEMIKEAHILDKRIVVPVCVNKKIVACRLDETAQLQRGLYGVWEPVVKEPVDLKQLDMVLVPGIAFDTQGNRLGRGKGYYDRFLEDLPDSVASVGLAFDFQILPSIPTALHDVAVDTVICG